MQMSIAVVIASFQEQPRSMIGNFEFYDALVNFQRVTIISGYHILQRTCFNLIDCTKHILLPGKFYRLNVARFNIAF